MTRTPGDDLVSWQVPQQFFIKVGQCIFCKERCIPHGHDGTVHEVVMGKINIKYPGHFAEVLSWLAKVKSVQFLSYKIYMCFGNNFRPTFSHIDPTEKAGLDIRGYINHAFISLINSQLSVCSCPTFQHFMDICQAVAGAQFVYHIIHKIQ